MAEGTVYQCVIVRNTMTESLTCLSLLIQPHPQTRETEMTKFFRNPVTLLLVYVIVMLELR